MAAQRAPSSRELLWGFVASAALTLIAFALTLDDPLHNWDDDLYITANARILDTRWQALFLLWDPSDAWTGRFIEYFPLRDSVYWLLHRAFDLTPWPYHLLNLFFHALCGGLVFGVGRRLEIPAAGAALAAALFVVHPVHVESVAWVAGLKDPMFTSCFLGATWFWLRDDSPRSTAIAAALLVVGLLVKSLIITLAPCLWLLDVLWRGRSVRDATVRVLPLAVVTALALAHMVFIARQNAVIVEYPGGTLVTGLMTTVWSLAIYVGKLLVPIDLNPRYIVEPVLRVSDPRFWGPLVVAAAVGAAAARSSPKRRLLAFGAAFYGVALLPVLGLVPFPVQVADRYQYHASLGPLWVLGALVAPVLVGRFAVSARATVGALLVVLLVSTWSQSLVWADPVLFWLEVADQPHADEHPFVANNVGSSLMRAGRPEEARAWFERAVAHPEDDLSVAPALANLAGFAERDGDLDQAVAYWRRALAIEPPDSRVLLQAAGFAERRGDFVAASERLARAAELKPRDTDILVALAINRFRTRDTAGSAEAFARAATVTPELCGLAGRFLRDMQGRGEPGVDDVASGLRGTCPDLRVP